jgi:hypothetical protein
MKNTRREFLAAASVSALVAGSVMGRGRDGQAAESGKADSGNHETSSASDPLEVQCRAARVNTGLKITNIETFTHGQDLSVVRIRTDDRAEGYGQVDPSDADITATVLHRKIAPLVLGADPADFEAISDRVIEANYKFPWSFVCRAQFLYGDRFRTF